jgi:hypothetical protein
MLQPWDAWCIFRERLNLGPEVDEFTTAFQSAWSAELDAEVDWLRAHGSARRISAKRRAAIANEVTERLISWYRHAGSPVAMSQYLSQAGFSQPGARPGKEWSDPWRRLSRAILPLRPAALVVHLLFQVVQESKGRVEG